ncbi:MAG TPA: hypothetical protein VM238_22890 [Phycisphaerae bacterium]|nr:hypothetical protein [Phycisphaerae bacterium]
MDHLESLAKKIAADLFSYYRGKNNRHATRLVMAFTEKGKEVMPGAGLVEDAATARILRQLTQSEIVNHKS